MAKTTSDSILGVIRKESWVLVFGFFTIFFHSGKPQPNVVMPPGEQHGVGGGLRCLTAFLVLVLVPTKDSLPSLEYVWRNCQ